ncbi:MAG: glycosyltransferase [Candidatus Woesebacteria bacterium]|nr:glycosyltransferase [Candidatus Woesebacteria bacterium]
MNLKNKKIVIVTHEYATGPSHALEDYLNKRVDRLLFIGHPFVFAKDIRSHYRFYDQGGKLREEKTFFSFGSNQIISAAKDVILSLIWILKKGRFDIFVGVDSLNSLSGIVLKKLGIVKKVIYYTIDYVPERFHSKLLNTIYLYLDSFVIKHSDIVWNLSQVMTEEREKRGVDKKFRQKQIIVPVGTEVNIPEIPFGKIKRYHVVHMGHLMRKHGVQLAIESIPHIIKVIPQFHLDIIGGGEYEEALKKLAKELEVSNYITFYGFIQSHRKLERMLSVCALGVAPYMDAEDSYVRNSDPGKVKAYLAAGLPVIITKVPLIWKELVKYRCGVAVSYNARDLARAIIWLLSENQRLRQYRKNAKYAAKRYTWSKIFSKALAKSL